MITQVWLKFKNSSFGWAIIVTTFALIFAVLASVLTGILSLPWVVDESSPNTDIILGAVFPILVFTLSLFFAKLAAKKDKRLKVAEILGFKKPKKNALWLTPIVLGGYLAVLLVVLSLLQVLSPELAEQKQDLATIVESLGNWRLAIMVFSVGFLTPIGEETFFRGLLTSLYSRKIKVAGAIFLSSFLFGLAHGQLNVGIDTFLFGLALGFLTYKTRSIYPAILLHMLKNLVAVWVILS